MFLAKLLHCINNDLVAAILAHWLCRIVGVAASTIPVTSGWLRIESDIATKQFTDSDHQIARHPHVVTRFNTSARADLVFPLSRHDFRVDACNLESSIKASLVMRISNWAANGTVITSTTIVWTLRTRESSPC